MMNKKRTKEIGRLKYLLLLPVSVLLFMLSSTPVNAQSKATTHPDGSVTIKHNGQDVEIKKAGDDAFSVPDEMPQYPGGEKAMLEFLSTNIKYPESAKQAKTEGRVTVQFIVGSDGACRDIKVLRSVSPDLDAEAIRVLSSMPKWTPGKFEGKPVPVRFTVPINFRAQ